MMTSERVETGIKGLDPLIDGGFPKGSLILLAGNPGTGKTIFSAQFLYRGAVDFGENGIYVSFAEGRETFYENMKGFGFDFERLERKGRFRFLDMLTLKENAVSSILNMIVEEASRVKAKRLVIDSYSALAQTFKDPIDVRIVVHTVMGKLIRGMGCTTLLIEEVPLGSDRIGFGVEEFVADGVIRLKTTELEDRLFRSLEVLKLRGTRLEGHKMVFTLDGGFKVFQPFESKPVEKPKRFQPVPDPPGKYSTGTRIFDEVLDGGLPRGSIMLMETDEKITTIQHRLLIDPIVANFVAQGRGIITIPSTGVNPLTVKEVFSIYGLTEEEWKRQARIFFIASTPLESFPNVVTVKGENWRKELDKLFEVSGQIITETGQPALFIIGADTLTTLYGEKQCEESLKLSATEARRIEAAVIVVVKAGYRDLAIKLSALADVYLRLTRRHGCTLLYGVKPRTPLYAVEMDTSEGYPLPKLTPIL